MNGDDIIIYLFIYAVFCAIAGVIGNDRRIGFQDTFGISIVFTPFVGVIVACLSPRNSDETRINEIVTSLRHANDMRLVQIRLMKKELLLKGVEHDEIDEIIKKGNQ